MTKFHAKSGYFGDITNCQGYDFESFSVAKGTILSALVLRSQGYGCRTPPSKFFIYASFNFSIIGSDNSLTPVRRQAIL